MAALIGSTQSRQIAPRRGITLLEVLISMFILLIGLMGVAAMIPAGKFEIQQGSQVDHASMVGRAAFRDLKIRGYLNPTPWRPGSGNSNWRDANGLDVWNGTGPFRNTVTSTNVATLPVAIDPLGAVNNGPTFPAGASFPLALLRIYPDFQINNGGNPAPNADPIFRSSDDNIFTPNTNKDFAPTQQVVPFGAGGTAIVKRDSVGSYTWLATVVPDPTASDLQSKMTVSVAVFFKRDLSGAGAGELYIAPSSSGPNTGVALVGGGIGGGEVTIQSPSLARGVKTGQWIMLAGTIGSAPQYAYFRWYRVVAADVLVAGASANTQNLTLAGADWTPVAANTGAFLFDNIIAVYEKNMRLEIP